MKKALDTFAWEQRQASHNVPAVRFKGFINPWQTKRFEELYTKVIEKNGKTVTFDSNHVISVARMQWSPTVKQFDAEYAKTYNVFRVGDIAFEGNRSGGFAYGRFVANDLGNGIVSHVFDVFRPVNEAQQDAVYMRYFIHNENVMRDVLRKSTTRATMMNSLDTPSLNHQLLHVPGLEEQQKIASLLSSVDETLYLCERKLDLLMQAKKALMQQIFSQKLRFKADDGSNFPEWEEKKLGQLLVQYKQMASKDGLYPHVSLTKEGVIPKTERYNRDFLVRQQDKQYRVTHKNDICYNPANLKFGVICRNKFGDGIFSPIYITYHVETGFLPEFIEALVTREDFINHALRFQEGTVYERMAVSPDDLEKIEVTVPSLPEQKKIASCLSSADALVDQARVELEQWQEVKKSLLQQLFV